jgi:hypothetical protein
VNEAYEKGLLSMPISTPYGFPIIQYVLLDINVAMFGLEARPSMWFRLL